MLKNKIRKNSWILLLLLIGFVHFNSQHALSQEKKTELNLISEASGGIQKWDITDYILFVAKGNALSPEFSESRAFLINKNNGDARFEATSNRGEKTVVLFNFKRNTLKKVFVNKKELEELDSFEKDYLPLIIKQFSEDSKRLFLPFLIANSRQDAKVMEDKIIDLEKLSPVQADGIQDLSGNSFNVTVFCSSETGEIRLANLDSQEFAIKNYKDIGGGVYLPTEFIDKKNPERSSEFSTVASFTHMEKEKFEGL